MNSEHSCRQDRAPPRPPQDCIRCRCPAHAASPLPAPAGGLQCRLLLGRLHQRIQACHGGPPRGRLSARALGAAGAARRNRRMAACPDRRRPACLRSAACMHEQPGGASFPPLPLRLVPVCLLSPCRDSTLPLRAFTPLSDSFPRPPHGSFGDRLHSLPTSAHVLALRLFSRVSPHTADSASASASVTQIESD